MKTMIMDESGFPVGEVNDEVHGQGVGDQELADSRSLYLATFALVGIVGK